MNKKFGFIKLWNFVFFLVIFLGLFYLNSNAEGFLENIEESIYFVNEKPIGVVICKLGDLSYLLAFKSSFDEIKEGEIGKIINEENKFNLVIVELGKYEGKEVNYNLYFKPGLGKKLFTVYFINDNIFYDKIILKGKGKEYYYFSQKNKDLKGFVFSTEGEIVGVFQNNRILFLNKIKSFFNKVKSGPIIGGFKDL